MTGKRFQKVLMGHGISKKEAKACAIFSRVFKIPYREAYVRIVERQFVLQKRFEHDTALMFSSSESVLSAESWDLSNAIVVQIDTDWKSELCVEHEYLEAVHQISKQEQISDYKILFIATGRWYLI